MKKTTFFKKLNNIRKGAINATANVISAPAQYKAFRAKGKADQDVKSIKLVRENKDAPDYDENGKETEMYYHRNRVTLLKAARDFKNKQASKKSK